MYKIRFVLLYIILILALTVRVMENFNIFSFTLLQKTYGSSIGETPEFRGAWINVNDTFSSDPLKGKEEIHSAFIMLKNLTINNIFWLVKASEGYLYYNSSIGPVSPKYMWDTLSVAIEEAHKFGIKLHAWIVVFRDMHLTGQRPDLVMVDSNGRNNTEWVCPKRKEVRNRLFSLVEEIVSNYDIDGVHLDYIRYPNSSFCYCKECCEQFTSETGIDPIKDPQNPLWVEWRCKQISEFVNSTYVLVKSLKPHVKVSAAVIPNPLTARNENFQDWEYWREKGFIDFLILMTYPALSSSGFRDWLKNIIGLTENINQIYAGIGIWYINATLLLEQIKITRILGFQGHVHFRYHPNSFTLDKIEVLKKAYSDTSPPIISKPFQNPPKENVSPFKQVTVYVNVTDVESGVQEVILSYKLNDASTWTNITMEKTNADTYMGRIPGYRAKTKVQYRIIAYDNVGNKAEENNAEKYFSYIVISESLLHLIFWVVFGTVVIVLALFLGCKLKKRQKQIIPKEGEGITTVHNPLLMQPTAHNKVY